MIAGLKSSGAQLTGAGSLEVASTKEPGSVQVLNSIRVASGSSHEVGNLRNGSTTRPAGQEPSEKGNSWGTGFRQPPRTALWLGSDGTPHTITSAAVTRFTSVVFRSDAVTP